MADINEKMRGVLRARLSGMLKVYGPRELIKGLIDALNKAKRPEYDIWAKSLNDIL